MIFFDEIDAFTDRVLIRDKWSSGRAYPEVMIISDATFENDPCPDQRSPHSYDSTLEAAITAAFFIFTCKDVLKQIRFPPYFRYD